MRRLIFVCFALLVSVAWAQEQSPKVAVMPFVIHTQEKMPQAQQSVQDLLIGQLSSEGVKTADPQEIQRAAKAGGPVMNESQARSVGDRVRAQYAVIGSFNQIGNTISVDAKLVDLTGGKKTESLYAEETGAENLAAVTKAIVTQITGRIASKGVISDVQVKGNDRIEAEAIKLNIKSAKGDALRQDLVSEDIKSIYKMGYFEKVDAEIQDSPAGKVLVFTVQENPTIQELRITGNKKIKEKDIIAAISTKAFAVLQRNVVNDDVQKILKMYQQKGYFAADVKGNIEFPKDPKKATVVFAIEENNKVYIKKIRFTGNKEISSRKLRGVMQTKQKSLLSLVTDRGILQKDVLDSDVDRITVFYHDKGFMDAKVGTPVVDRKKDGFYIDIPIQEGDRYKVQTVKVEGDVYDGKENPAKKLKLKEKDYFSREGLRRDVDKISKAYMDEGYAHTEVDPDVKRHPDTDTTDVTYNVKKGELVHIGKIFITGNTKTRDKVIRRELQLSEGDLFNSTNLEKSMQRLKKLDYFEQVEIVPTESDQSDIMNLNVKVKEKFTGTISIGGGFSSDEGFFASGEITQRNFLGRGQYLGFKGHLGQEASRYMVSFTEPYLLDMPLSAGIDLYNWQRDYTDFSKDSVGGRLRFGTYFGSYSKITGGYTYEVSEVTEIAENPGAYLRSQQGEHIKSSIEVGIERDTTDHPFLPTRGNHTTLMGEYSSEAIGSEGDWLKTEFRTSFYHTLFWKFVGSVKGQIGRIYDVGPEPEPIFERFFLGGINNLRGFKWGDIGPKDRRGNIIGGLSYFVGTVEVVFPILEQYGIHGVAFYDTGNAYRKNVIFSDRRDDAGLGLRWNSPMGPLRVEWGYNIDPEPGEDKFQWQFSAGAFF
ncbi:MAG: outer membrane protein assembly factor BamA [Syntrophobacteraceae bacterium]